MALSPRCRVFFDLRMRAGGNIAECNRPGGRQLQPQPLPQPKPHNQNQNQNHTSGSAAGTADERPGGDRLARARAKIVLIHICVVVCGPSGFGSRRDRRPDFGTPHSRVGRAQARSCVARAPDETLTLLDSTPSPKKGKKSKKQKTKPCCAVVVLYHQMVQYHRWYPSIWSVLSFFNREEASCRCGEVFSF